MGERKPKPSSQTNEEWPADYERAEVIAEKAKKSKQGKE